MEEININDASDSEDDEELAIPLKKIRKNDFKEDSDDAADEEFGKSERQEEAIEDERYDLDAFAAAYGRQPGYLIREAAERERAAEAKAIEAIKRAVQRTPTGANDEDTIDDDFTAGGVFASA